MINEESGFWDFRSTIQALQRPLSDALGSEGAEEVTFHISEVLTDFGRLQHEMLAIVKRSSDQSAPADLSACGAASCACACATVSNAVATAMAMGVARQVRCRAARGVLNVM